MKPYPVIALLMMLTGASCADDHRYSPAESCEAIAFGVSESAARSRAECPVQSPDMLTLLPQTPADGPDSVRVYASTAPTAQAAPEGRGTPVTGPDQIGSFRTYAFFHADAAAEARPFFAGETATRGGGNLWTTSTLYYWPTTPGSTLSFAAIAGADNPGVSLPAAPASPDALAIAYEVPADASQQTDLMLAATGRINTPGTPVPLSFSHLCAAVRFVTGAEMQPGTIKSITLSGIKDRGVYTTEWTDVAGSASFVLTPGRDTAADTPAGTAITTDYNTLMMIPQQLTADATLTVVFQDRFTGRERTMSASLAGARWKQGHTTTYHIGISPDFELEFTQPVEAQDAHYVICNSAIRISGLPADKTWKLTATADDGADVSVQLTADINEFVRQGFWTDKEMNNGTPTNTSARGTATVTGSGSGDFPLTVFLPENVGDTDRTVTLRLSVDGTADRYAATQQIAQLPPLWNGNEGWEQIDDNNQGMYGFMYTTVRVYVYHKTSDVFTSARVETMIKNLISTYNAAAYVTYGRYTISLGRYRWWVRIDYAKLNNLEGIADSPTDGLVNTRRLFDHGGAAISGTFEEALKNTRRIGDTSNDAFRPRANTDPSSVPTETEGTEITQSQALTLVLKKNRYYLNIVSNDEATTRAPRILPDDIVWYMPAYGQFSGQPAGGTAPADYWSSTSAGDFEHSYAGDGTSTVRNVVKKVRAARNR